VACVSALPGDMGYFLGVQEFCDDFFCQSGRLAMFNYSIPPPAEHKGIFIVNITISYPQDIVFFLERYNAYDSKTGRYFFVTVNNDGAGNIYEFYIVNVFAEPVTVVSQPFTEANHLQMSSLQWDSQTNTLFGVLDSAIYVIDIETLALKQLGGLDLGNKSIVTLPEEYDTAFDSATGHYFVPIMDETDGIRRLVTFDTRNPSASWMTGNLNNGDYWIMYGFKYNPKNDTLIAYTYNPRGWPSVKIIDYHTGMHWDLVPEWIWGDYDVEYTVWPDSDETNNLNALDTELNIFWMTVRYTDPEDTEYEAVVYYNLTKAPTDLMGSGPMVLYENACWFTNQQWFAF